MNATAPNLNPVNPVQGPSAAGKQAAAAPDAPFSQVLSSEIAQNRSNAKAQQDRRADAGAEAESAPAGFGETAAATATEATETEASKRDPLQSPGAETGLPLTQNLPVIPDALLALAANLGLLKSAPTAADSTLSENPAALGANTTPFFDTRKGAARPAWLAGQGADETASAPKIDVSLTGKTDSSAAMANTAPHATAAAAFAGQLAAARQSDALKVGERLLDIVSNPALSVTPQALLDAAVPLSSAAANTLAPSVGAAAWNQALGDKIVWMAAGAQQTASLTLNPPHLGPLQIVLNLTNDQATASFFTAQPEVRQALEAAFPRLREMLNEAGIQLGQATVSADTPRQNDTPERQAQRIVTPFAGTDDAAGLHSAPLPVRQSGRGLVDTFA